MAKEARKIDWNKLHPWMKMANDFAEANQGYFAISTESAEFALWLRYFRGLGWSPWGFRRLLDLGQPESQWTAPCQFPEWLPNLEEWRAAHRPAAPGSAA